LTKPTLILIGPLPPPYHGVTVSTTLVLKNSLLRQRFALLHVDTSDHRELANITRWDPQNVKLGLRAAMRLARARTTPPAIVYLPLSQSAPGFLRDSLFIHIAALRRWKVAVHLRGSDFRAFYDGSPVSLKRWIRLTLGQVTSVALMGTSLHWVADGLVPRERITVVPNGTPEPQTDGAPRHEATVLFLSNLMRRKGAAEAVETALIVLRRHPSARFTFVGEWEDEQLSRELRRRASDSGDRIRFLQPVTAAAKDRLLASSSLLLFPPVEPEGHPRVVLEAMAAGLPVVATRRGAIAETVTDGENGFLVDEPVPAELAERVLRLLRDEDLRLRMGAAARRRHLERFTQEVADRQLADWLWNVADAS
jgi:glycosyltransferase involved in cell wall biosynthesis